MALQYKIPQNVQLEDKIVLFLTMKQLIICGIGFGIAYVIYITLAKSYYAEVWAPPVFIVVAITCAVAFLKIKRLSFIKWCLLMIEAMILPHKRIWDKRYSTELFLKYVVPPKKVKKKEEAAEQQEERNLDDLTKHLDYHNLVTDEHHETSLAQAPDHELAAQAVSN
jgi:hypothetical protein